MLTGLTTMRTSMGHIKRNMSTMKRMAELNSPANYNNKFYWIRPLNNDLYGLGLQQSFITDNGYLSHVNIDINRYDILNYGDQFGTIELESGEFDLGIPFDKCMLTDTKVFTDKTVSKINRNPEDKTNHLFIFKDMSNSFRYSELYYYNIVIN
jgi:hypothetical protein